MQRHLTALAFAALSLATSAASATDVTVATWNLGWHLDTPLATRWIAACSQKFSKPAQGELWRPDPTGTKTGWQLRWGRDARIEWDIGQMPPCDVWQSRFKPVAVTEAALAKRCSSSATCSVSALDERDSPPVRRCNQPFFGSVMAGF